MASGNTSLLITEDASWETFPASANQFLQQFNGRVLFRADTVVERVWIVVIRWRPFFLSYDDFCEGVSLEPMSKFGNSVVFDLYKALAEE